MIANVEVKTTVTLEMSRENMALVVDALGKTSKYNRTQAGVSEAENDALIAFWRVLDSAVNGPGAA